MKLSLVPSTVAIAPPERALPPGLPLPVMQTIDLAQRPMFIERPPLFVYDPHETGLGGGLSYGWTADRTPLAFRTVFNARSIGQRLVVDSSGGIVLDDILRDEAACASQLAHFADRSSSLYHEDTDVQLRNGSYESDRLDTPHVFIDEPVISLMSVEPSNYGSWLFRVLPKLLFLERIGNPDFKIACWAPHQWQQDLLAFFGITPERIININLGICYHYREIHVPVVINPVAYMGEDTLSFYRRTLENHGIEKKRERLIYISRQTRAAAAGYVNVRHFVDEPQMVEAMRDIGFEIVEPEMLSIVEQARLFSSAAMVVGASGAGMFNTAFCAPGTGIVDIEAFDSWLYAHCNYFSSCGHAYGIAFGKVDQDDHESWHKRWTIGVPGLVRKIQHLRAAISDV